MGFFRTILRAIVTEWPFKERWGGGGGGGSGTEGDFIGRKVRPPTRTTEKEEEESGSRQPTGHNFQRKMEEGVTTTQKNGHLQI